VLFDELNLPKTRKTTQGYTTDAQALEALRAYLAGNSGVRFMTGGEIADWYRSSVGASAR